jgi:hypothetical protein
MSEIRNLPTLIAVSVRNTELCEATMKKIFGILLCVAAPCLLFAQSTSLQRIEVTSVTLHLDSVNTIEEMTLVKQAIMAHKEIRDFDIKMKNCNFTMEAGKDKLDQIVDELQVAYRQPVKVYSMRVNEQFTRVPEESCDANKTKRPDMSEQEVKQRGITRKGGQ